LIQACGASLVYEDHGREVFAVRAVDLTVHDGEFLGILGPSGSGKSSLLYLLSGLKTPSAGEIRLDGQALASRTETERAEIRLTRFGFVFQHPHLLGYLSALENVLLARPDGDRRPEAETLLTTLGLADKAHRLPYELSGGERQRVCVARALMGRPRAVFADEPTAALDHRNGVQVVEMLNQGRGDGALIIVTHDPTMLVHADRIVTLVDGEIAETPD